MKKHTVLFASVLLALSAPSLGLEEGARAPGFSAPRLDSGDTRWRLFATSEHYYPAYGGSFWIDQETHRVLRIELQARDLPYKFRYYLAEINIEYEFVRLDEGLRELMPVRTEALSCIRLAPNCQRNSSLFSNYAKFGAASTIAFDEVQ